MDVRVTITHLAFSDGTRIKLDPSDTVVIVGANNSGKSLSLREILRHLKDPTSGAGTCVRSIDIQTHGTEDQFLTYLRASAMRTDGEASNPSHYGLNWGTQLSTAKHRWSNARSGLQELTPLFCHLLDTTGRLAAGNPAPNIEPFSQSYTHPIHYLQFDDSLEARISKDMRKAFRHDLVVNRNAGATVPLHVGTVPRPTPPNDRLSKVYSDQLRALPRLQEQGDGMRSFVGVLLETSTIPRSIVLIDEPEAFLHPPQARLLGRMLAKRGDAVSQLLIATHSGDVLRGLLDADSRTLRVIRIRRDGHINYAKELSPDRIATLWQDPLLRYSNALDGLFHEHVVICESDSDCRFYGAIYDAMLDAQGEGEREDAAPRRDMEERRDIMLVHCGGKDRIPLVASALKEIGVPLSVACDLDVLRDRVTLQKIVQSLGGDWEPLESLWREVHNAIETKKTELRPLDIAREIGTILKEEETKATLSNAAIQRIQVSLRRSTPWSQIKDGGFSFIPSGGPTRAAQELIHRLSLMGLFVVEVGELEGFDRSVSDHGPGWVNRALQKDLAHDPALAQARQFVARVFGQPRLAGVQTP